MSYVSEKYQIGALQPFLEEKYGDFIYEGTVYSIPIDVLATDGEDVISIELKSRNHKRGLAQAKRNTSFVDFSYLSVWASQVTDYLIDQVDETPIGLIAVDDNVNILRKGNRVEPNPHAKAVTQETINDAI